MSADEEMARANEELQQLLWDALDNCFRAGAPKDDLSFLAWQCGLTDWRPATNVIQLRRA